jgi:RND family efflux transporter MFP subunit
MLAASQPLRFCAECAGSAGSAGSAGYAISAERDRWEYTMRSLREVHVERRIASARYAAMILACVVGAPTMVLAQVSEIEGLTEPYRSIDVAAPEPGVITRILVQEGHLVRQGQILATLDNEVHLATLAVAQKNMEAIGTLNSAVAELQLRKDRLESFLALRAKEYARQEEVDRARAELAIAEAKLLTVQEDLAIKKLEYEKIKAQVERRIIRAPADGAITKLFKDEGEYAAPNDPTLFTLVQLHRLLAVFSVPSQAAQRIENEQPVSISFPDLPSPAKGIVEFVSPVTDAESGTVRVKVRIDNLQASYRSGERCTLELSHEKRTAKR